MPERSEALETSQPERSRDRRDEQPENMLERSEAPEVSQPERSRDRRDEQSRNIKERSEALETSQLETSRACRDEQPENILRKPEALETSSFDRLILLQFDKSLNMSYPSETATLSLTTTDLTRARLSYQGRDEPSHAHVPRTSPCEGSMSEPT